jgi:hypothetical protein
LARYFPWPAGGFSSSFTGLSSTYRLFLQPLFTIPLLILIFEIYVYKHERRIFENCYLHCWKNKCGANVVKKGPKHEIFLPFQPVYDKEEIPNFFLPELSRDRVDVIFFS